MGKELLYVFIGGGTGSVIRYLLSGWLNPSFRSFPLGTFVSNILSSLILGVLLYLLLDRLTSSHWMRWMLMVGFCGGFSTFSTFTMENFQLIKNGDYGSFVLYALLSIGISLAAFAAGAWLAKSV